MPKGKGGARFTAKQDRQAQHVADSMRDKGRSAKEARSIGYATVNAQKKGGKSKGK